MAEVFLAHPGHKALAALSTVTMQLNKQVRKESLDLVRLHSGDSGNLATREMIKAIKAFKSGHRIAIRATETGWSFCQFYKHGVRSLEVPFKHVDWVLVHAALTPDQLLVHPGPKDCKWVSWIVENPERFRANRPYMHGGALDSDDEDNVAADDELKYNDFCLERCREVDFCKFQPEFYISTDHYRNVLQLAKYFDAVYVKLDTKFDLPDNTCLYVWPSNVCNLKRFSKLRCEQDPRFIVVLRKE